MVSTTKNILSILSTCAIGVLGFSASHPPTPRMKSLDNYLARIGLPSFDEIKGNGSGDVNVVTHELLSQIMEAQSKNIPFENFDIVAGKTISIEESDIEEKLVDRCRGGYCFELNNLLRTALEAIGYDVTPLLCRVRWGNADDSEGPNSPLNHIVLKVKTADKGTFIADVGFGGTNSRRPVSLDVADEPQHLPEGSFRVVPSKHAHFHVLQLQIKNEWTPLYEWREERAPFIDQVVGNWYACSHPESFFTRSLFAFRIVVGDERHLILNEKYIIRRGYGEEKIETVEIITEKMRLLELMDEVFGAKDFDIEGIDRYLSASE